MGNAWAWVLVCTPGRVAGCLFFTRIQAGLEGPQLSVWLPVAFGCNKLLLRAVQGVLIVIKFAAVKSTAVLPLCLATV